MRSHLPAAVKASSTECTSITVASAGHAGGGGDDDDEAGGGEA